MDGPVPLVLFTALTAAIGLVVLAAALESHLFAPLSGLMRAVLCVLGLGMIAPNIQVNVVSAAIMAVMFVAHTLRRKRAAV